MDCLNCLRFHRRDGCPLPSLMVSCNVDDLNVTAIICFLGVPIISPPKHVCIPPTPPPPQMISRDGHIPRILAFRTCCCSLPSPLWTLYLTKNLTNVTTRSKYLFWAKFGMQTALPDVPVGEKTNGLANKLLVYPRDFIRIAIIRCFLHRPLCTNARRLTQEQGSKIQVCKVERVVTTSESTPPLMEVCVGLQFVRVPKRGNRHGQKKDRLQK